MGGAGGPVEPRTLRFEEEAEEEPTEGEFGNSVVMGDLRSSPAPQWDGSHTPLG